MRKGLLSALVAPICFAGLSHAQAPAVAPAPLSDAGCSQVSFDNLCGAPACKSSWLKVDYLAWWTKNGPLAGPVLTTGTPDSNGIIGAEGTLPLYAPGGLDYNVLQGGRITWGKWFDPCQTWGVEVSGFVLESGRTNFTAASDETGFPLIAFPILTARGNNNIAAIGDTFPSSYLVANQDQFAGIVNVSSSQRFWGFEANLLKNAWTSCNSRLDIIMGYRQLGLAESLQQRSVSTVLENGVAGYLGEILQPGETLAVQDQIRTNNHFYGGQIGARYTHNIGKLDVSLAGTIALGWTHESFNLQGSTAATRLDDSVDFTPLGGLYVQGTNSGETTRNRFSYVPELRADVAYHFNDCVSVGMGYTFIYWSNVARPGSQVDPIIDQQQQPSSIFYDASQTATHPARRDADTSFWAQGLSFQVGFRY